MITVLCGAACSGGTKAAPHVAKTAPEAPQAKSAPSPDPVQPLALGALEFDDPATGTAIFALSADGILLLGTHVIGSLSTDGHFSFAGLDAQHTASAYLSAAGRVEIVGRPDLPADAPLPGDLATLLAKFNGHVTSAFVIDGDTAHIGAAINISIGSDDVLSDRVHKLHVSGLTPATRKTALFVYVLLSTILS